MDPATWPFIGDVIKIFTGAADKLIPDRNQRFSMSVEAATGNIRAELGGQGWLNSNWRAVVSLGIWGEILWWLAIQRPWDWHFFFLVSLGIVCLTGYVLNRETLAIIAEFFKTMLQIQREAAENELKIEKEKKP